MVFCHPFLLCLMLCWPFFCPLQVNAKSEFTKQVQSGYEDILKLKTEKGRGILQKALAQDPDNICAILVSNYADCITLLLTEDLTKTEGLISNQQARISAIKKIKEKTPYKLFAEAEIHLQLALCKVKSGNELQGAWDFRKAYVLLEENSRLYPEFIPNKKTLGLLHILIGSVPQKYQWILNSLGFKGNIKQGRAELRQAVEVKNPFATEASVIEALVNEYLFKENSQSVTFFKELSAGHPDNLLYHYFYGSVLKKVKRGDLAIATLTSRPKGKEYLPLPYAHHMLGDLYLYKGETDEAITEYELFLKVYKGENYLKNTHYQLYLCHYLNNQPAKAEKHLGTVQKVGKSFLEEDKYAQEMALRKNKPNKTLLLARLQSDGGYYVDALQTINAFNPYKQQQTPDLLEFYYRKGRIYHSLNEILLAKANYQKTIELAGKDPLYYAPNSCLQLAYLFLAEKDTVNARKYFEKALTYPKHEYKTSIDSKAKIGLAQLD